MEALLWGGGVAETWDTKDLFTGDGDALLETEGVGGTEMDGVELL